MIVCSQTLHLNTSQSPLQQLQQRNLTTELSICARGVIYISQRACCPLLKAPCMFEGLTTPWWWALVFLCWGASCQCFLPVVHITHKKRQAGLGHAASARCSLVQATHTCMSPDTWQVSRTAPKDDWATQHCAPSTQHTCTPNSRQAALAHTMHQYANLSASAHLYKLTNDYSQQ